MTDRNDVLLKWKSEEATVRARLAAPGVASPQDVKASSGIEFLQRIFNGELPSPPIAETLGFVPIAAEPGRVVFQGTPDRRHYNPLGGVHGGYFCTLLDSALGCAIHSTLPKGVGYTTLELKVNLILANMQRSGPNALITKSTIGLMESTVHCGLDVPNPEILALTLGAPASAVTAAGRFAKPYSATPIIRVPTITQVPMSDSAQAGQPSAQSERNADRVAPG
jgi:hypothetical protein